jgi:hypothetical protein
MQEIRVHTNFTNAIAQQHVIQLAELRSVESRELLRNCFLHPECLQPSQTRESVTAQAASEFAKIVVALRRHYDERRVAHFINNWFFASSLRISSFCPIEFSPISAEIGEEEVLARLLALNLERAAGGL